MAPVEQYLIANRDAEVALARTAAPPSISAAAEVLILGRRGYETAVRGTNGFASATRQQVIDKTRAAFASHRFVDPEAGSFSFMLSKEGYVSDAALGPWLPHLMFFVRSGQAATWGAGLEGSPVVGVNGSAIEPTVLMIPVRRWSDGSAAPPPASELRPESATP
ncbi:MAG TPA: hypothetical protein VFA27_17440 [Vicinamibacterales bacterium]|nr:hypothetical protein [Vicinamibacterales bacterium]